MNPYEWYAQNVAGESVPASSFSLPNIELSTNMWPTLYYRWPPPQWTAFDHTWPVSFRWTHMSDLSQDVVGKRIPSSIFSLSSIELSTIRDLRRLWNLSPMLPHLSSGRLSRRQPVSSSSYIMQIILIMLLQCVSIFLFFRFGVYIPKFLREITQDSSGAVTFLLMPSLNIQLWWQIMMFEKLTRKKSEGKRLETDNTS